MFAVFDWEEDTGSVFRASFSTIDVLQISKEPHHCRRSVYIVADAFICSIKSLEFFLNHRFPFLVL